MSNEVLIEVKSKETGNGFDSADKKASRFGGTLGRVGGIADKASGGIGRVARGAGIVGVAVGVAGGAIIGAGVKITDYAGKLELMDKKAATVFGGQIGQVTDWAAKNAHGMGLTNREATGLAASMADLLIPMKFTREEATQMATKTIGLSGALAEWSQGQVTAAEAADILQAAFLGERDGLQQLGISVSQAEVDAELLKKGQQELTGVQRQQAEATATQKLIFEKSKDAQDAFANGAGGLARKSAESKARMKEMGETITTKLTPVLLKLGGIFQKDVLPKIEKFVNWVAGPGKYKIAEGFLGMAQSATGMVKVFGPVMKTLTSIFLATVGSLVDGAARAFGWVPGVGPKLRAASAGFRDFSTKTMSSFDTVIRKANDWDRTLANTRKTLRLQADIEDLNSKINTAKAKLRDPSLSATKRAHLQADIRQLLNAKNRAQSAINSLRGKTVTVTQVNRFITERIIRQQTGGSGGHAPGFAHGGLTGGRTVMVGERGPELAELPAGTRIRDAASTRQMATGGGNGPTIIQFNVGNSPKWIQALFEDMRNQIRREGGDVQVVLGQ